MFCFNLGVKWIVLRFTENLSMIDIKTRPSFIFRRPPLLLNQSDKKKKIQCIQNKVPEVPSQSRFALPNLLLRNCQHKQLTQIVNHPVLLQPGVIGYHTSRGVTLRALGDHSDRLVLHI